LVRVIQPGNRLSSEFNMSSSPVRPPPSSSYSGRPKNRLLACLPDDDFHRIQSVITTIPTAVRQSFHKHGERIDHVYFPNGGVASVTAMMQDGGTVEVATVGDEGVLGVAAMFGDGPSAGETMMQVPDTNAERMSADAFRAELDQHGALYECVNRYSHALLNLIMQSTACMALHPVQERCCRWLLMTHDRVHRDEFQLSHEFLAMMLGSTRPTVTVIAGTLQQAGLIRYKHGRITIQDRGALEAASCECYQITKTNFDRLGL
jgi:CRP-like cAMP-binding protein